MMAAGHEVASKVGRRRKILETRGREGKVKGVYIQMNYKQ